jgi:hypothetical protein
VSWIWFVSESHTVQMLEVYYVLVIADRSGRAV